MTLMVKYKQVMSKSPSSAPSEANLSTENRITNYILLFFACAMIGWIWEVILTWIQTGHLVNRGVLHGPWLPIYGFGGAGIAILLHRFKKHPSVVFLASVVGCGILEYFTGWYLETFKHLKWWDYSDLWLNLDGRICFISLLAFGICGLFIIYLIYPFFTKLFDRLPLRPKKILCFALVLCFLADFVYSSDVPNTGEGITDEITSVQVNA